MKLKNYMRDGACAQARAVLAYLVDRTIEESWNDQFKCYDAEPEVGRWENCREQGYVLSLTSNDRKKRINIAFFEHRNSDSICAIRWEQWTLNSPTIDTAKFGDYCYSTKWDVNKSVSYGDVTTMADWIWEQLEYFWNEGEILIEDKNKS